MNPLSIGKSIFVCLIKIINYLGYEKNDIHFMHSDRLDVYKRQVQQHCEANSYGVVREFVGHGTGKDMHEDPQVPNYGKRGFGTLLKKGMCLSLIHIYCLK